MSLYKTIGLPMNEIDMRENGVSWLHSGKSVVQSDFHRQVDRFEARVEPDPLRGPLVDEVYGKWLRHNAAQAKVIVALCMGIARLLAHARAAITRDISAVPRSVRVEAHRDRNCRPAMLDTPSAIPS